MSEDTETKRPIDATGRLNRLVRLLRWPENKRTGVVPWFVIAWRVLFYPTLIVSLWIAFLSILCAYGLNKAMMFWDNAT